MVAHLRQKTAALSACAVVLAAMLAGCSDHAHSALPTTTQATTTTTVATVPQPYEWQRDTSSALDLGGGPTSTLSAVLAPSQGRGWLIAGTQLTRAGTTLPTVWTSSDTTRWSETVLPLPAGTTSAAADAAVYWGTDAVVVGSAGTGPTANAAVWVSDKAGRPFSLVPGTPALVSPGTGQSGAVMYTLAAGALGVFAAGTVNGRATVWYSTDAHSWSVISGAGTAINHDPGAVINDLLMTPSGVFAAGSSVSSNSLSAALWYSTDGLHWDTVRSAEATFSGNGDHEITSLVDMGETGSSQLGSPGPTSLLAVGGVRSGANWQPASWISPDGVSWSQASESFPLDNEPSGSLGALAYAATSAGQHVLAVGGSPSRQRLWVSSAGQAWSEVPLPATAAGATNWHLGLVAGTSTTTVVADNLPGQPYVLVRSGGTWHEPSARGTFGKPLQTAVPTSLVSDNGTLVMSVQRSGAGDALGSGTTSVALLTSADGKTWRVASTDAFDNATVNQLLPVQGGLLAVGSARASSHSHGMPGALVAVSGEAGRVWRTTGISPGGLGQGSQGAVAAGRLGQSEYVVGRAGTQAVSWYSPDGATWEPSRPLDPAPELGVEQPLATCSGPDDAVVVGSVTQTARGTVAAAWVSTDGSSWSNATIVPGQPPGASAVIEGCLFTGNGFIAYGETTGSGEAEGPALWSSTDGTTWQRQTAIFVGLSGRGPVGAEASPLDGIAYGSTTWLGVSGQGDLPTQRWPAPAGGAAGAAPLSAGLWASLDAGSTWQQLSTGMPPFVSAIYAQTDQAVYVGQQPVVAGTVDGKLAVWVGSPTPTDGT